MDNFNDYIFKNFDYHIENVLRFPNYRNEFEFGEFKFGFYRDNKHVKLGFMDTRLPRITEKVYHELLPSKPKFRIVGDKLIPSFESGIIQSNIRTVEKRIYYENNPLNYLIEIPTYDVKVNGKSTASKVDRVIYNDMLTRTVMEWTHHDPYIDQWVNETQLKIEIDDAVRKMYSEIPIYYEKNSKFISENKILESL